MKVGVLGTGMVGQAHAGRLAELGHEVVIGTRDVPAALGRIEQGQMTEAFGPWAQKHKDVKVGTFSETVKHGDLIINALSGTAALGALKSLAKVLEGKVLVDISNPLDFSSGELRLSVSNGDSLGEQIQKALPKTRVVKAFNTTNASVQVNPGSVAGADHHLFMAGNDKKAKEEVTKLAKSYGWKNIVELGDIKSARGMEMVLPLWVNLFGVLGSAQFNFKIAK